MSIHHPKLKFREELKKRSETKYIILHHVKKTGRRYDVKEIHQWHLNRETNGEKWAGIAYHFYVDKDGKIFIGRPLNTIGAHTYGYNSVSVGICFEGDFNVEEMGKIQLDVSVLLISILSLGYHNAKIRGHRDFNKEETCPGDKFPMEELLDRIKIQKKKFIRLHGDPEKVDYSFLLKLLE